MILYFIRHGDPIYEPNGLTELGYKQAEALVTRFKKYGLDEIYSSPSNRAYLTAIPTSNYLKKEIKIEEWTDELFPWNELTVPYKDSITWSYSHPDYISLFRSSEIRSMCDLWYKHPMFENTNFEKGITRINLCTDEFLKRLGYLHNRDKGCYKVLNSNNKRIGLFAHQGFGLAFLSSLLDIPYPQFCTSFDIGHSGVTVINFEERDGYAYPKILQLSNDSHLVLSGINLPYQNIFEI